MVYTLFQQEVTDYDQWRTVFDSMAAVRRSAGTRDERIFRSADEPNAVTLLMAWDSIDDARSWMNDARLREAMKAAGVQGQPRITFLHES